MTNNISLRQLESIADQHTEDITQLKKDLGFCEQRQFELKDDLMSSLEKNRRCIEEGLKQIRDEVISRTSSFDKKLLLIAFLTIVGFSITIYYLFDVNEQILLLFR